MVRENINTPEHYNELYSSGRYDSVGIGRMERIIRAFAHIVNIWKKPQRILDVGCGEGAGANFFAEFGRDALEVYGVDFCPIAIRNARMGKASGGKYEPPRVFGKVAEFRCEDIRHGLNWPDEYFNGIMALEILEHMAEPEKLAAEMLRVLKPLGRIFYTTPKPAVVFEDPEHIQAFERKDLIALFSPHSTLVLNDTDWPRNFWGVVEKKP